jgi:hypothetical protein
VGPGTHSLEIGALLCHRPGGLNYKHLSLTALETGKSEVKTPADLMSGKGWLLGVQMVSSSCVCNWAKRTSSVPASFSS